MKFTDSFGNEVKDGTHITILGTYGHSWMHNETGVVFWDEKHGQYRFKLDCEKCSIGHDFWGIHEFKVEIS